VAILGIGGLGHLAIQFASKMGFPHRRHRARYRQRAIGEATGGRTLHRQHRDRSGGGTSASGRRQDHRRNRDEPTAIAGAIGGLSVDGRVVVLGADFYGDGAQHRRVDPHAYGLVRVAFGSSIDSEDTMKFSAMHGVRPMTRRFPLEKAQEAYAG